MTHQNAQNGVGDTFTKVKNPLPGCCDGTKNRPCKMNCSRETTVTSLCPPRRLLCEVPLIIVIGPFLDSVSTHFYIFFHVIIIIITLS